MNLLIKNNDNRFIKFIQDKWHIILLCIIAAFSFFLNFYAISKYGYGNDYYAAAILSMTKSIKNFFFVSFDPSGLVSVDKPPIALWIQAIFVLILGYHGWVLFLPQALASTGCTILIYNLTNKYFDKKTALLSSFIFSITPIVVAVSRNNTMDMQLIFVLLLATKFLFKSLENSKWRYLFIAALLIGIGFNIKMLQAYLVLPAFALTYLLFAKEKLSKRFLGGSIAVLIMLIVSLSWATIVELYPASERPYIDSTSNNSVYELIFGHNGAERLFGQDYNNPQGPNGPQGNPNGPQGPNGPEGSSNGPQGSPNDPEKPNNAQVSNDPQKGNPPGEQMENSQKNPPPFMDNNKNDSSKTSLNDDSIGNASLIRLWFSNIYGQISWLLLLCLFSIIAYAKKFKLKEASPKHAYFAFWIIWLLTTYVFFSFAGFYHRYYLCMMAAPIAILSASGIFKMFEEFNNKTSWKKFILPVAIASTMVLQFMHIMINDNLPGFLLPTMLVATSLFFILVAVNYFKSYLILNPIIKILMLIALLIAPLYWSFTPIMYVPSFVMPSAGPHLNMTDSNDINFTTPASGLSFDQSLSMEQYLMSNYKEGSFLVVSRRAQSVANYIINTGLPCYAYGGFLGNDNSLSLEKLKELIDEGKIRYFLVSDEGGADNDEITKYVKEHGKEVTPNDISGASSFIDKSNSIPGNNSTLYYLGN